MTCTRSYAESSHVFINQNRVILTGDLKLKNMRVPKNYLSEFVKLINLLRHFSKIKDQRRGVGLKCFDFSL